ncbi:transcriptional regulator, LacI family [Pseudarthrobacter chlorophenolicus A6]|uniref:Transcriptional regulator, LacI family n=1 Tax=Pseudarthrobacter chlorophenolicus (strain ATCC 700700 / DSM 12829 / CIP 107037 / JCM 12360 / KCTC 9906 / NCIMB 13794 / A6) TaxID=452863 RepID=B8H8E5_PSECP|nr:transcriptional regulator, LacI family [Pseudarthrobacter chlorophenolicus A6]SDQ54950.1 DNA-binding transcriptional regulator, LacI/PurR family [Pseudarthrobacter chlorophenolicus]
MEWDDCTVKASTDSASARPTIYDVAHRAGVSKSLVSLVLRGSPNVSDPRREAVQAAIDELGYRPSRAASALAANRTQSIGLLIDDFHNPWFVEVLRGLRSVLDPAGWNISVADLQLEALSGRNPLDGFLAMHVDGLIIAAEPHAAPPLRNLDVPFVVAGVRELDSGPADVVASDEVQGAGLAVEHLVQLGHRRIAHLSGTGGSAKARLDGYLRSVRAAGLEPLVVGESGDTTEEAGYTAARELFSGHDGVTAVFAANDTMALGALAALKEHGLRTPEDVSVVGYDNTPLAESRYLDLTSIDSHNASIGSEAARALLGRIAEPSAPRRQLLLAPSLMARGSTAAPPS